MRRPIVNNSRPGQLVYDPFLGSGTTLIAAEMTGRLCCGLEISPAYVDVILQRWKSFSGRTAIHQASGQSFDERAESQDRDQSGSADG
jgi:DNA modification methylase